MLNPGDKFVFKDHVPNVSRKILTFVEELKDEEKDVLYSESEYRGCTAMESRRFRALLRHGSVVVVERAPVASL